MLAETARQDCMGFSNIAWLAESFTYFDRLMKNCIPQGQVSVTTVFEGDWG